MGIRIGIGGLTIGSSSSRGWTTQYKSLCDFLWVEGKLSATELLDQSGNNNHVTITGKDFVTDYIPATSAATFDCPNNAIFIANDTDNLWINKNEESRGVEVSELIGYDFARTIVWYDNDAPHHIRAIMILKSTVTLTAAQINKMHTDFRLSMFWSGVLNVNGFVKENRGLAQNVWTAVSEAALNYSDTYQTAVLADGGEIISRKVLESEYQRLINTGDIATCWYSYHWQCGIKRVNVDYGANGIHNMVAKWYNLSPVAGRFAESVAPYSIVSGTDARPEYTASGLLFRPTNLDGGTRGGLESGLTVLPNNNNTVRQRAIVIPVGASIICSKGYQTDEGYLTLADITTTRKLGINYRITGANKVRSTTEGNAFVNAAEVEVEATALFTGAKTIAWKKNGAALTAGGFVADTPIYPTISYQDCVGCARSLGRTPYNGYIKQIELFTL